MYSHIGESSESFGISFVWLLIVKYITSLSSQSISQYFQSKYRPSGSMLSISQNVRVCVCSLLRYHLSIFSPPLPEIGCSKCLDIQNPWGKVMVKRVSDRKTLPKKGCKIATQKKMFLGEFCLTEQDFFCICVSHYI